MSDGGGGPPLPWPGAGGAPENARGGGIDTKCAGYDDEERGSVDDDDDVEYGGGSMDGCEVADDAPVAAVAASRGSVVDDEPVVPGW